MTEEPTIRRVLVVGATGATGRQVAAAATRHGLTVRALARNPARARKVLPGIEIVPGDLRDPASLTAAVEDVDTIVFTHGATGAGDYKYVDYGGVANILRAVGARRVRIALMTSINVTRLDSGYRDLLDWKRRSERLVRTSGHPYTIVRPGWFDMTGPGEDRIDLEQGDTGNGAVRRDQVAEVLIRSLLTDTARSRTVEVFATAGATPTDWDGVFSAAAPDVPGAIDGVRDTDNMPLDQEPPLLLEDLEALTTR